MEDLFGSVIPDARLIIYQLIFPAGYQSLFVVIILVLAAILFNSTLKILLFKSKKENQKNSKNILLKALMILFLSGCIPIIGGFFLELLLYDSTLDLKKLKEQQESSGKTLNPISKAILYLTSIFLTLFVFFIIPIGGYLLYYYLRVLPNLLLAIGADFGVLFLLRKKYSSSGKLVISLLENKSPSRKIIIISFMIPTLFVSVFLSCWYFPSHMSPDIAYTGSNGENTLKIVTYNVRNGIALDGEDSWDNRKEYFIEQVSSFDMDILGLQEAYLFQINDVVDGLNDNLELRTFQWTGLGRDDGVHGGEHTPIIFDSQKYNYLDGGTFWFGENPKIPKKGFEDACGCKRITTWARFEIIENNTQFMVFCTHFGIGDVFKELGSSFLIQQVEELSGDLSTFVIGDFNLNSSSIGYDTMKNSAVKPLNDAYSLCNGPGPHLIDSTNSFDPNGDKNSNKIDFIFVSGTISAINCEVNQDTYVKKGVERCYSDHYPVILECNF